MSVERGSLITTVICMSTAEILVSSIITFSLRICNASMKRDPVGPIEKAPPLG